MCFSNSPQIDAVNAMNENPLNDLRNILDQDSEHSILHDSNYFLPEEISIEQSNSYGLRVMHLNIRSLVGKLDELKLLLEKLKNQEILIDVILVCETFLTDTNKNLVDIASYTLEESHRKNRSGGGVAIYLSKTLKYKRRKDLEIFNEGQVESIFVELESCAKNVIMGELYRVPNSDINFFLREYKNLTNKLDAENKHVIIGTDQNLDYLKVNIHSNTDKFLNINLDSELVPMITRPTRVTHSSATLIDNIYLKSSTSKTAAALLLTEISDHFPCLLFYGSANNRKADPVLIETRKMNDNKLNALKSYLDQTNWNILTPMNSDEAYSYFIDDFTSKLNSVAPVTTVRISAKNILKEKWMTAGLLKSSKTCDRLYKSQLGVQKDDPKHIRYIQYRNNFNKSKRLAKQNFFKGMINNFKNNSKKLWMFLNTVVGKARDKKCIPEKIKTTDDVYIMGTKQITEYFCSFFSNIGPKLASSIPASLRSYDDYMQVYNNYNLFMTPTNQYEILKIITKLKNKGSSGYDNISNILLKQLCPQICAPLSIIFNKSLSEGIFPEKMKLAEVIPVYKSKDIYSCTNYRPISLLPVVSKVLEKVVYRRLYNFLIRNELLYNSQYGFRSGHSTINAITEFVGKIIDGFENKKLTLGVFFDLSKAFDTIDHNILLSKLNRYGIRGTSLNWFKSYLDCRSQRVKNGEKSSYVSTVVPVTCGVPQGSVLGPLLFLIYMNDIHSNLVHSSCILFADDTTLYYTGKNLAEIIDYIKVDLNILSDWFKANKLSLNVSKTNAILFRPVGSQPNDHDTLNLTIGNEVIDQVSSTKFLGLIIDEHLTFKNHVSFVASKVTSSNYVLRRLKNVMPNWTKRLLYMSSIQSHLTYGLMLWGSMAQAKDLQRLFKAQKKSLRLIDNASYNSSTDPIFKKYDILKLEDLIQLELSKFMYKFVRKTLPSPLLNLFQTNNQVHNYNTRGANNARTQHHTSSIYHKSFLAQGPQSWSLLPNVVKNSNTLSTFSKKLKKNKILYYRNF